MRIKSRIFCYLVVALVSLTMSYKSTHASIYAYDLFGLEVVDNNYWVCGANGQVLHSVDGNSWAAQKTGVDVTLTSIAFVNSRKGFCVGGNGTVLKTEDGGNRWVKVSINSKYLLTGIYFVNANKGFITGEFGGLFLTEDGGEHWKPLLGNQLDAIFQSIDFYEGKYGWVVGEFGAVYQSSDGGITWKKVNVGAEEYTLFGVKAFDKNRVMITSMDGLLFVTDNGGKTWKKKTIGQMKNQFFGVEFFSNNEVYIFGRGVLLKTNADLSNAQSIDLGKELAYGWIYKFRKNLGVGNDGYVYKFVNGKFNKERIKYNNN